MSQRQTPKILIVEDESITARDIQQSLESLGYQVCGLAMTGEDAIRQTAESQPDLVLMDIRLRDGMDGTQAAAEIYQQFQLPVVFLTAFFDEQTLTSATQAMPFGYITKPFELATLRNTLEVALVRHYHESQMRQNWETSESLRQKAEALSTLRPRYLAVTAHEFRNPLSAIMLSSTILEKYGQNWTEEKKKQYLKRITSAVTDINQLLEEMVMLEQAENFTLPFAPQPLDVVQLCQRLVQQLQPLDREQLQIQFQVQGKTQLAYMDRNLLRHIFTNLLSNAIKYSLPGEPIEFILRFEAEVVVWQVRDYGVGIPTDALPHLFDLFYRANNVGKVKGTGLGLTIVKNCVDLHGGEITVDSQENQGTTFTVSIPLVPIPSMP